MPTCLDSAACSNLLHDITALPACPHVLVLQPPATCMISLLSECCSSAFELPELPGKCPGNTLLPVLFMHPKRGTCCGARREGKEYQQSYQRGRPLNGLAEAKLPRRESKATGTEVRFLYDSSVFSRGCGCSAHALDAAVTPSSSCGEGCMRMQWCRGAAAGRTGTD